MPPILYGTAWKKERTAALVRQALEAGFRGIDTACQPRHYHEAGVGEAVRACGIPRSELYLQTKFTPAEGQDADTIPYDPATPLPQQVADSFKVSQRNLQTDYVDALVLHSPLFPFKDLLLVWRAMEEIVQNGGALRIGISNCYDLKLLQRLHAEAQIKPSIVQNRFYAQSDYDMQLRAWCREEGIAYQSFWSLTANPHLLGSDTIMRLAMKYRKTTPQILFAYLISREVTPLSGTTSTAHMQEDLEAPGISLTAQEIEEITALLG